MPSPASTALLVPVKDLTRAKTRLAPLLTHAERRGLAMTMLEGTLRAVRAVAVPCHRVVVTSYGPAMELAQSLGLAVIREARQRSESHSVDAASVALEREGVTAVLRVPLDLPLVRAEDLEAVLAAGQAAPVVLVPSWAGTGTNALYRSPPTLFPSRFGPGSLALHQAAAREAGAPARVLPVDRLALDIDDPADVRELLRRGIPCPALDYLHGIGIEARPALRAAR